MKQLLKFSLVRTLPILFSYVFLGIAFGIMMQEAGMHALWSGLAGIIIYTGAFQIAFVGLVKGGATLAELLLTAGIMGSRHIFYGFSFLDDYRRGGKKFGYLAFSLTDETYALDCALTQVPDGMNRQTVELIMHLACQCYWVTGCVLGGLIGALIPFNFTGIDFCMTALFVTILIDQWKAFEKAGGGFLRHLPALAGGFFSVIFLALLGPSRFLLPTLATTTALLLALSARTGKEAPDHE